MFSVDLIEASKRDAYNHGHNNGYLGLDLTNPYPPGSVKHKQYEWGWFEANDEISELASAHYDRLADMCGDM